jgi:hypothetical protein
MSNAPCVQWNNCTIVSGAQTNGTYYVAHYDPTAYVPLWHQHMELATVCVCNSLTCELSLFTPVGIGYRLSSRNFLADNLTVLLIVGRLWYRRTRLGKLRKDDCWMAAAGVGSPNSDIQTTD